MLYLIRHGETAGNAGGIVQFPDVPLNQRGREQARRLGERLADTGIELILSSDYRRARMTAEAVQVATGAELRFEPLLRERHFGDLRGRSHAEIGDLYAADLEPPNGESWALFHSRVEQAWYVVTEMTATVRGRMAVISHGLVCYSLAARQLSLPEGEVATMAFRNTALTEIEPRPPWRVTRLNCIAHLEGAAARPVAGGV
jgi:broad specificity phosphatase PhoE